MGIPCNKCGEMLKAEGYAGHKCKDNELKPCPFCGGEDLDYIFSGSQGYIECNNCSTCGPHDKKAADPDCDIHAAYDIWNRRHA